MPKKVKGRYIYARAHIERVLLDVVVVLVVGGGAAAPEAVLAEAVVVAALALVAQTGERVATASLARHRVIHCSTHTDTQLLARWPGTLSRILSGTQREAQTVLGVYLKLSCSRVTSASSALMVLDDYALYKSTHSLTHKTCFNKAILKQQTLPPTRLARWTHLVRRRLRQDATNTMQHSTSTTYTHIRLTRDR